MGNRLLPGCIDNTYRGHELALWLFAVIVFVRASQGVAAIVSSYSIAISADGIPLETFPVTAAQTVVTTFAISGLSRLIISLVGILAFVRYRSAITLMFSLLALDYVGRQLILHFYPIVRVGSPIGPTVNHILFALTFLGLVLSLWSKRDLRAQK